MNAVWATWESALKRIETLKQHYGIWPGIICRPDGTYTLTCDPGVTNG